MVKQTSHPLKTLTLALGLVFILLNVPTALSADVPDLPKAQLQKYGKGKAVFLEFYADWCHTCQVLEPYVDLIKRKTGDKMAIVKLDVDNPKNSDMVDLFKVEGTPSFYIFNPDGTPTYQMTYIIQSNYLFLASLRAVDRLPKVDIKELGMTQTSKPSMTMLSFEPENCKSCSTANKNVDKMMPLFKGYFNRKAFGTDDKTAAPIMTKLKFEKDKPGYLLVDEEGYVLYRHVGALHMKELFKTVQHFKQSDL